MSLLGELSLIEDRGVRSAPLQMAIDEALLELTDTPVLRFYRWRGLSTSIGYFSRFADVTDLDANREVVRRWTGGGIVSHGHDFTYSLIVPETYALATTPARVVYTEVHSAMQRALQQSGAETTLASSTSPKISDACFANPARADLLLDGEKIAGAAQRRTRAGLLHQGSLQLPDLDASFGSQFASELCRHSHAAHLPEEIVERAAMLAKIRYATPEWLWRR